MISFTSPEIEDRQWIEAYLQFANNRACEYNFVNLLIWRNKYYQKVAKVFDTLVVRIRASIGHSYLYPIGPGDRKRAIEEIEKDALERGEDLQFICLSPAHVEELTQFFPGQFTIAKERDSFDYLYAIDSLADLTGKRYQAKRNHINRFVSECPDWSSERITAENLPECLEMAENWYQLHEGTTQDQSFNDEHDALLITAEHYEAMGMDGILIRSSNRIVAFAIGKRIASDTFDVFFEKAYVDIQGAYAIVNREFAGHIRETYEGITLINREDDMGLEGLRKAKESYHPIQMEEKSFAIKKLKDIG